MSNNRVVVTGAGGFIGGHLVQDLLQQGLDVRAVDVKPLHDWYQVATEADSRQLDLRRRETCEMSVRDCDAVYNLAADMGGMGFIENNRAACMLSVLINTHLLQAPSRPASSATSTHPPPASTRRASRCSPDVTALREADAYPAEPEDGYGWEKLFSERMCRHFREDYGLTTRVARYHNVYGPYGTFDGGREKAPAAICRKIIEAKLSGIHQIEIWGDGEQTRSFMYIDDCVYGTQAIMSSSIEYPINLGSSELVTINQLVDIVAEIAGIKVERRHDLSAPQGVRGRNSDNTLILEELAWEPSIRLQDGLERTYRWIHDQLAVKVAA